jgi:phosphopantetheinyl transferase
VKTILREINNVKIALLKVDDLIHEIPQKKIRESKFSTKRIIEKYGIQTLLAKFLPNEEIIYNDNGKPFLLSNSHFISISHNAEWIGLAWSSTKNIGLDIEHCQPKIERISSRFLHVDEIAFAVTIADKTTIWCIKECLVKLLDNKKIDFKNELRSIKTDDQNWKGYSTLNLEKVYSFVIFQENNSLICINTN